MGSKNALNSEDEMAGAYANLGLTFIEQDLTKEAIAAFEKALTLDPNFIAIVPILAVAHAKIGSWKRSEQFFREALSRDRDNEDLQSNLALVLIQLERLDDAKEIFLSMIRLNQQHSQAWYGLACIHARMEKKQDCLVALEQALDFDPSLAKAAAVDNDLKLVHEEDNFKALINRRTKISKAA